MNKIVSIKNTSAIFLAIVLVLGTIATISPSFIVRAQAELYYDGMDSYKKLNGKDVSVKSVKCNNINVNVNGLEFEGLPPFLGNLISDENGNGYGDASSYENSERNYENAQQSGSENNFKFICINNNNNTVVIEELEPPIIPPSPPEVACEDCFSVLSETQINELLLDVEERSLETFCEELANRPNTNSETTGVIGVLEDVQGITLDELNTIIECLIDVGVIQRIQV